MLRSVLIRLTSYIEVHLELIIVTTIYAWSGHRLEIVIVSKGKNSVYRI